MSEPVSSHKSLLTNVVIVRPLLVVLLVFYHAFAIYSGGWKPINGFPEIRLYWWLDKLSYAFMLELFVLISGYVFGYQVRTKGDYKLKAKYLIPNKIKRLMLPSVLFSILYYCIFRGFSTQSIIKTVYEIIIGTGHMWFLPMLFMCFLIIMVVERFNITPKILIPILFIISCCPLPQLPINLNQTFYFFSFFYLGYFVQRKDVDFTKYYNTKTCFILGALFFVLFSSLTMINDKISYTIEATNITIGLKAIALAFNNFSRVIFSITGIAWVFCIISVLEKKNRIVIHQWIIEFGGLSMGVYIFQQFVLKLLYNYSNLPYWAGPYFLPWLGFFITLFGSVILTWIFLKTRVGRALIG